MLSRVRACKMHWHVVAEYDALYINLLLRFIRLDAFRFPLAFVARATYIALVLYRRDGYEYITINEFEFFFSCSLTISDLFYWRRFSLSTVSRRSFVINLFFQNAVKRARDSSKGSLINATNRFFYFVFFCVYLRHNWQFEKSKHTPFAKRSISLALLSNTELYWCVPTILR